MQNDFQNQTLILYADASAPQHSCLAGLGGVVTSQSGVAPLFTLSRRIELKKSCTLHAELLAINAGLGILPSQSTALLRSDSISALWLLHVTGTIPYQNTQELERMAGGKQTRLELRKKRQEQVFRSLLEECQKVTTTQQLCLQSLWIKGHANNEAHALADRLAASALKEGKKQHDQK